MESGEQMPSIPLRCVEAAAKSKSNPYRSACLISLASWQCMLGEPHPDCLLAGRFIFSSGLHQKIASVPSMQRSVNEEIVTPRRLFEIALGAIVMHVNQRPSFVASFQDRLVLEGL